MWSRDPGPGLLGRRREGEALDRVVANLRTGRSGVLVVRGEAGVGKTALLDHLAERATGCRIARAVGVESEMELAFAALHQLCAPLLDRLDGLPGPQRDALGTAFGLSAGEPPDRFLVGLAVIGLLAEASGDEPLVCIVDDAQWLDRVSLQTLAFVARRLASEPIALAFGVREPCDVRELAGLPELAVRGLSDRDAHALLDSAIPGPVDARVRDRIVAETRGNPLALLELPRGLTPAELAGGFGLGAMPVAGRIEQGFLRRLEPLPADARRLLLVAAAEPVGDATLLWRAAERLGIGAGAAAAVEAAGLIEIGARVRFRHPLVRSAAYRAAAPEERRRAHRALASVTDADVDPDRRAWHRAQAVSAPDEDVAAELERSAARARDRGGIAAAAAFLERATALTRDPARRGARALAAAQAKLDAAAPERASALLATAELCPLDALQRARLHRIRAQVTFARGRGSDAVPSLLDAARRLEPLDAALARETYVEALGAVALAGVLGGDRMLREAAEAARAAPAGPQPPRAIDLLLDGLAIRLTDGHAAGHEPLKRGLRALVDEEGSGEEHLRWLWLASPVAHEVWDCEAWHRLAARAVAFARDAGALTVLPTALVYLAGVRTHAGDFAAASALLEEAAGINEATGNTPFRTSSLVLSAWRGPRAEALEVIEAGIADATARGEGRALSAAEYARAVLCNGLGHYRTALAAAERACRYDDLGLRAWALTELIEAAVRCDRRDAAADAFPRLEERTRAGGNDWALGIEARARALLGHGREAEAKYRESIERLAGSGLDLYLARSRLLYGEWLRREGRRVDAREQLRTAHAWFADVGATAFAERAGRELAATGETVRKRRVETRDELTAQEAEIARLARDGRTNPEIGARLFISPRTVEWHLRKVFAKLDISSRRELPAVLDDANGEGTAMAA